jgi:hypothetical protein
MILQKRQTEMLAKLLIIPPFDEPTDEPPYSIFFWEVINPYPLIRHIQMEGNGYFIDSWLYLLRRPSILHWVIKLRFDSKYKLPMTRLQIKQTKALGTLYAAIFKGCRELRDYTNGAYMNTAHWFCEIMIESRVEGFSEGTKFKTIKRLRKENKEIAQYHNPIEKEYPHTYLFFQLLLARAEQRDIIRKEILVPLKQARAAYATFLRDSAMQIAFIDNQGQEIWQLPGSGTGVQYPPKFGTSDEIQDWLK